MFDSFNFGLPYIFIFVSGIVTFLVFSYDKIKSEGWETVYIYLNKNTLNFIRWGKDKNVIKLTLEIYNSLFYLFWSSLGTLILISYVKFLDFLIAPLLYVLIFCMYSFMSFKWVFDHKNEANAFFNLIKVPILIVLISISFSLFFGAPQIIEEINKVSNDRFFSLQELYYYGFSIIIIIGITVFFGTYILMWMFFGFIPTCILLFFYILTKLSVLIEKIIGIKRFKTLLVIINFISIFIASFYQG